MENLYGKKIKLYDWQKEVNPAEDSFVIAPTGAGKSIAAYRWAFDDSDKKVIFTAPIYNLLYKHKGFKVVTNLKFLKKGFKNL